MCGDTSLMTRAVVEGSSGGGSASLCAENGPPTNKKTILQICDRYSE